MTVLSCTRLPSPAKSWPRAWDKSSRRKEYAMKRLVCFVLLCVPLVGCGKKDGTAGNKAADETARDWLRAAADCKPVIIWRDLPPTYQQDATGLVKEFAGKMDAEVWNKTFAVLRKGV